MPSIEKHVTTSLKRTGKAFREVHEWIDEPTYKIERHDLGRILEFAPLLTERFGQGAAEEYVRHLQDDVELRFSEMARVMNAALNDNLTYFGCRS